MWRHYLYPLDGPNIQCLLPRPKFTKLVDEKLRNTNMIFSTTKKFRDSLAKKKGLCFRGSSIFYHLTFDLSPKPKKKWMPSPKECSQWHILIDNHTVIVTFKPSKKSVWWKSCRTKRTAKTRIKISQMWKSSFNLMVKLCVLILNRFLLVFG